MIALGHHLRDRSAQDRAWTALRRIEIQRNGTRREGRHRPGARSAHVCRHARHPAAARNPYYRRGWLEGPDEHVEPRERGGERCFRTPQHLSRGTAPNDPSAFDDHDVVGECDSVDEVVCDEHRAALPLGDQRPQQRAHLLCHIHIERSERFVEEQDVWLGREGACDRDTLRLSPRQLFRGTVGELGNTDRGEPSFGTGCHLFARQTRGLRPECDVARNAHVGEQTWLLSKQHHRPAMRWHKGFPVLQTAAVVVDRRVVGAS
ncbi:hypothetical protein GOSPT_086_00170 [Gordonia sputi NBRC 100414]|uniref:Uncharacterized protein n=1 Tax=Gordonia sputi NBRC 100414 TaxID=1089453 RepID=H5U2R2_9ACTN|nr:hypothetical protein GOSPT_086_00170 [Gordonia sputi NBRC 100414]